MVGFTPLNPLLKYQWQEKDIHILQNTQMSLKCLCAVKIKDANLDCKDLPQSLLEFMELH
jgi:hypothetical protein